MFREYITLIRSFNFQGKYKISSLDEEKGGFLQGEGKSKFNILMDMYLISMWES